MTRCLSVCLNDTGCSSVCINTDEHPVPFSTVSFEPTGEHPVNLLVSILSF